MYILKKKQLYFDFLTEGSAISLEDSYLELKFETEHKVCDNIPYATSQHRRVVQ